ncbi:MAG: ATP-binding protein [Blastocatellia bacterium]
MYKRLLRPQLLDALADTPVVFLNGARQTGKSTLVRDLADGAHPARYLTFDDAAVLAAARHDPAGFVAGLEGPVIIDEVQHAPDIFPALKLAVDRDRQPGRFLLTGSANILLLPRVSESLAGRMEILTLWPLSQGEIEGIEENLIDHLFSAQFALPRIAPKDISTRADLLDRVARGGYPEALGRKTEERRRDWFSAYITTILQRDVREMANIEGLTELPRVLTLLATRASSLHNLAEISRGVSIPQTTLRRYLTLLETTFLLAPLPAWSSNLGKRLVKAPKLALSDTGLLTYLLGATKERLAEDSSVLGRALENFVVTELRKQSSAGKTKPQLFHFRTESDQEVDVVLEDAAGRLVGVEVKANAAVTGGDFKGLRALQEMTGKRFTRGVVLYTGAESVPFGPDLFALPIESLWRPLSSA